MKNPFKEATLSHSKTIHKDRKLKKIYFSWKQSRIVELEVVYDSHIPKYSVT